MQPCTFVQVARPRFISLIGLLTVYLVSTSLAYASTPASLYEQNNPGEEVYFLLEDHLGSVDIVTDESGNVVEERDFLPYGEERISNTPSGTSAAETPQKFTGKELDEETGLYYYGARYYDPMIGRFMSVDPLVLDNAKKTKEDLYSILQNPQKLNAYSYVINNPLYYLDFFGESAESMAGFGRQLDGAVKLILAFKLGGGKPATTFPLIMAGLEEIRSGFVLSTTEKDTKINTLTTKALKATEKVVSDFIPIVDEHMVEKTIETVTFENAFRKFGQAVEGAGKAFSNKVNKMLDKVMKNNKTPENIQSSKKTNDEKQK